MRFEVLGALRVGRQNPVPLRSPTQRKILATLIARAGGHVGVTELVDALWPSAPPANAVKNVQSYVAKLRSVLSECGPTPIRSLPGGYAVDLDLVEVDAREFESLVQRSRQALGAADPASAGLLLDRAFELWHGRPYADLPDFSFVQPEVERLTQRRLAALELGLDLGRGDALLPDLSVLARERPYQDRPTALLMRALYAAGRRADALNAYHRLRSRLADDLGIDPSNELQDLHRQMLRGDVEVRTTGIRKTDKGGGPAPPSDDRHRCVVVDQMPRPPKYLQRRPAQLAALRELPVGPEPAVCALIGPPGVGKTQVAAAYARSRLAESWSVVWLDAESEEQLVTGLAHLADAAGIRCDGEDSVRAAGRARRWLSKLGAPGLLVLDNAADPDFVRHWLPATGPVQVLITTNRRAFSWLGEHVDVDVFGIDQARALLLDGTGAWVAGDADGATRLAEALGGHPLALALATAVIARERLDFEEYVRRLQALPIAEVVTGYGGDPYHRGVVDATLVALSAIENREPEARPLAELVAVLSPDGVARRLLLLDSPDEPTGASRSRAIGALVESSLLSHGHAGRLVIMHRLSRRIVVERAAEDGRLDSVVASTTSLLGMLMHRGTTYEDATELLGHLESVLAVTERFRLIGGHVRQLLELCASVIRWFHDLCDTIRVGPFNRAVLAEQERIFALSNPTLLRSQRNMAREYRQHGRLSDAMALLEHTLAGQRQLLGEEHPETLRTLYELAALHGTAGRPHDARRLLEHLSAEQERLLGADHPDLLTTHKRLAWVLRSLGDLASATALCERVVGAMSETLGPYHPRTRRARSDLACIYRSAGRLPEAIDLLEADLRHRDAAERGHPDYVHDRDRLAGAYRATGQASRAIPMFEQTCREWDRSLGPDHPWAILARNNLACAYEAAGDLKPAIDLFRRAELDSGRILGSAHPRTHNVRNNLGCAYQEAGRSEEAARVLEDVVADRARLLGADHLDTSTSKHNLTVACLSVGQRRGSDGLLEDPGGQTGAHSLEHDHSSALWLRNANAWAAVHAVDETIRLPGPASAVVDVPDVRSQGL